MSTRTRVGSVVSPLGFTTPNVPALGTETQVERTAAFFAVRCTWLGDLFCHVSTFGVSTGKELHGPAYTSVVPKYRSNAGQRTVRKVTIADRAADHCGDVEIDSSRRPDARLGSEDRPGEPEMIGTDQGTQAVAH